MIRLQILSGKQAGQVILVRRFPFCIGRSAEAGLSLADSGVWDDHCRIEHRGGSGFILVGAPESRTLINDEPAAGEQHLVNSAEITLGAVRLRFSLADPTRRRLAIREAITWIFLAAILAGQVWLITWLPR